jgi:hypothetical protein
MNSWSLLPNQSGPETARITLPKRVQPQPDLGPSDDFQVGSYDYRRVLVKRQLGLPWIWAQASVSLAGLDLV